jgi:hypothetical protein
MPPRPTSSIYSDPFELDDLLRRLSEQARSQGEYAIQVLTQENEAVKSELSYFRRSWAVIYELMTKVNDILRELKAVMAEMNATIEREQNKYKANCTAI